MKYKCKCGNISEIRFDDFKQGRRCMKCGIENRAKKRKHSFEYIYSCFEDEGCKLLEKEYKNNRVKMRYICSCGNINEITFNSFRDGIRCNKCSERRRRRRMTFEEIYDCFKEEECILLEKEYKSNSTKMLYKCSCGDVNKITFANFQNGKRCKKCGIKKRSESNKFTLKFVYNYFKEQRCELLEKEYINSQTLMRYICNCGNISEITFNNFKTGQRCKKCSKERRTQTMMERYGVPYFINGCGYSKESQKLFDAIFEKLNTKQKNKTYYATLNKEFGVNYDGKWFNYDYVNSKSKKVIEYNGQIWHPQLYQKNNEIGWFALDKNKTVKEARDYEKIKYEGLKKRGYQILTVWDYELHKDLDTLVQKCLDFLVI